ncbi:MAG: sel1 repeat family protein, partial [Proteobacteria bacterium]
MPRLIRSSTFFLTLFLCATLCACKPAMPAYAHPFTSQSDLALLSEQGVLPRNINLKTFDPHRDASGFTCRNQAASAPALTLQAEEMHEQAMALTRGDLWPNERDWPQAMKLWDQAAAQKHWKAALMWLQTARTGAGVNSEKGQFKVLPQTPEEVVSKMEVLMRQGVADAFFWMGEFHSVGYGVQLSTDREWAFYELAADLGSPLAQTAIAGVLNLGKREMEASTKAEWSNVTLRYRLLECAHSQGYGKASYSLGLILDVAAAGGRLTPPSTTPEEQFARALQILHDGVKFGSEDAAGYLSSSLRSGDPINRHQIDKVRADRYHALADALWHNPDLRFPNLDRVLPLP